MRGLALAGALALGLLHAAPAHACPGCSNPNLPGARAGGSESLGAGEALFSLQLSATTMRVVHPESCPDIGPICAVRDEPPQQHDQRFWVGELRPIVEVGLNRTWGVELQLPLRLTRTGITFRRMDGTAFVPDYENIHHRNETLGGLGDPLLSGRGSWQLGRVRLSAKAGVSLPLGRTEENPFALGRAGQVHQHLQFGAGTVAPALGVDSSLRLGKFSLGGNVQALLFPFENGKGYRPGHRISGGLSLERALLPRLSAFVGADLLNEQPERWDGQVEQDGNVGRTDALVGGGVRYALRKTLLSLTVKAPVWQHFLEGAHAEDGAHSHEGMPAQLTYPAIVSLSVQQRFGGGR